MNRDRASGLTIVVGAPALLPAGSLTMDVRGRGHIKLGGAARALGAGPQQVRAGAA